MPGFSVKEVTNVRYFEVACTYTSIITFTYEFIPPLAYFKQDPVRPGVGIIAPLLGWMSSLLWIPVADP